MTDTQYPVNQAFDIFGVFLNGVNALFDPVLVTLYVQQPSGTQTSYIYPGGDGTIIRNSVGDYQAQISGTSSGTLIYKWEGTGTPPNCATPDVPIVILGSVFDA